VAVSSRQKVLKTGKQAYRSVLTNGWSSSGMADERKVGCRHVLRFGGVGKPEWTCSEHCTSEIRVRNWTQCQAEDQRTHHHQHHQIQRRLTGAGDALAGLQTSGFAAEQNVTVTRHVTYLVHRPAHKHSLLTHRS